jgi:hypothetical protein
MSDAISKPIGLLKSTGYSGSTFTKDRMAIGPCDHVDTKLIAVFVDAVQRLYAAVAAARTLPENPGPERNALQQLLVASAAIAATEGEAIITLCSFGLCAPARIHGRALGDIARRCLLLPDRPDVALQMYASIEASRKELLKKVPEDHPARKALEPRFAEVDSKTMEQIAHRAYDEDDQDEGMFMGPYEAKMLSKWNHADIIALADAGTRLLAADERVRTTLVIDYDADLMIHRALGKVLAILHVMIEMFGVNLRTELNGLIERHAEFVPRFQAETAALEARLGVGEAKPAN